MGTIRRRTAALAAALAVLAPLASAAALGRDPGLPQQWGLAQTRAPAAWDRGLVGSGSVVAVIDTGADLGHEDLRGQIAAAVTCVNTDGDPGRCTAGGDDIQGHGTHIAGIAAAAANDVGVSGVAPGARLVVVRVFQERAGTRGTEYEAVAADVGAGIRWVIANVATKGAINLSLGGNALVTSILGTGFDDAVEDAWSAGWVPVLASGNENWFGLGGASNYGSMNAVVVGATGPDGGLAPYSSPFGSAKWAVVAPGGAAEGDEQRSACEAQPDRCVLSTYPGGYALLQGTSMATPHVAGALAVLMGAGMTNAQAVERLLASADRSHPCGRGCDGRVDLDAATAALVAGAAPTPAVVGVMTTTGPPPSSTAPPTTARSAAPSATRAPAVRASDSVTTAPAPPLATVAPGGDQTEAAQPGGESLAGPAADEPARAVDAGGAPGGGGDLPAAPVAVAIVLLAAVAGRAVLLRGGARP